MPLIASGLFEGGSFVAPVRNVQAFGVTANPVTTPVYAQGIPDRVDIVRDPRGAGLVLRTTVFDDDPDTAGSDTGVRKRSEIRCDDNPFGVFWYSFDVLVFAEDWHPSLDFSLCQLHKEDGGAVGGSHQPFVLSLQRGGLQVSLPGPGIMPTTGGSYTSWRPATMPIRWGQWHRVAFGVNWAPNTTGWREVWIDGARVWSQRGVATAYDEAFPGYLKLGIYNIYTHAAGWGMLRAYFRNVRIWQGAGAHADILGGPRASMRRTVSAYAHH
jgi:hypothetical protein